jgi:hypothetical protein
LYALSNIVLFVCNIEHRLRQDTAAIVYTREHGSS